MEKWIAGLTGGYKRGVDWWAEHRSAANPGSCRGREATSLEFISGCEAARARLAPVDVKRKSDPEYRRGWNTYNDAPTTQPVAAGPPVPPIGQVDGSDRNNPQLPRNFSSVSSGADSAATSEHTAASFDCQHASTHIERMICANPICWRSTTRCPDCTRRWSNRKPRNNGAPSSGRGGRNATSAAIPPVSPNFIGAG